MSFESDEFDEFDLSEFTSEELALFDTSVSRMLHSDPQTTPRESSSAAPAVDVVLESSEPSESKPQDAPSNTTYQFQPATKDSPYTRFCSRKKAFAVTELVFPLWYVGVILSNLGFHSVSYQGVRFNMNMGSGVR